MVYKIYSPYKTAVFLWVKRGFRVNGLVSSEMELKINYNFRLFSFYSFYI